MRPLFDMMCIKLAGCPTLAARIAVALVDRATPCDVFRHVALGTATATNLTACADNFYHRFHEQRFALLKIGELRVKPFGKFGYGGVPYLLCSIGFQPLT